MPLLLSLAPALVPLALWILERIILRTGSNQELRDLHVRLSRAFRDAGIANVRSRFESEEQIDSGNSEWDRIEAQANKEQNDGSGKSQDADGKNGPT